MFLVNVQQFLPSSVDNTKCLKPQPSSSSQVGDDVKLLGSEYPLIEKW